MAGKVKQKTQEADAWSATKDELCLQMTRATFETWLKDAEFLGTEDSAFVIGVRSQYAREWLENRLDETIRRTLAAIRGIDTAVRYVVHEEPSSPTAPGALKVDVSPPPPAQQRQTPDESPGEFRRIRPPTDPLKAHVPISIYAIRFWREYLCQKWGSDGAKAFDLWLIISGYAYEFEILQKDAPSIKKLLAKLGLGDRNDLVGRPGGRYNGRKNTGKVGLFNILRYEHICNHRTTGQRRGVKHYYDQMTRIEHAPLLTPAQVAELTPDGQEEHDEWLRLHAGVNYDEWLADNRITRIPELDLDEDP